MTHQPAQRPPSIRTRQRHAISSQETHDFTSGALGVRFPTASSRNSSSGERGQCSRRGCCDDVGQSHRKGRALSPHLQGLQQLSSGPGTNNCLMDQRGEAAQFVGTTESALAYWTTRSIKATCSMLSRPPLSPAIANPASVASVTSSWSVEVRAGISILPAPDGPFIHPRSAEPTRLCLSHHRPGSEAVTQPALTCRGLEARASKGFLFDTAPHLCPRLARPASLHAPRVNLPGPGAPKSAGASPRTGVESGDSPPGTASSSVRVSLTGRPS